ncbi:DUF4488 domain-containing protein [Sphingobacterium litopenaei]|uniref:DUF4488 domain-containing protein n=1 Tax=Sphingobacterium litopenaei TaxID=2763500 RepID=A0ABR7YIB6_9SPHI|nr:DUF4488 domain-containing protein [Sphingobacterium litopenaei]MBD1430948.1 DUF4488 domain-containing protein [Sphingobacterium litopenaei]
MRIFLTFIYLVLFTTGLFAQTNPSLAGVWKLSEFKDGNGELINVHPVFYKFFDNTDSFTNLSLRDTGLTFAHKGKYSLDVHNNTYTETVVKLNQSNTQAVTAVNTLKITFNEDKSSFTIEGTIQSVNGQFALYEVWTKLD